MRFVSVSAKSSYLLILLLSGALSVRAAELAENQGRFGVVEGDVGFLPQGSSEWLEPHEGMPIESGDQIRTADDSQAELRMSPNVLWVLQPETQVAAERTDSRSGRLHLTAGALLGKVDSSRVPIQQRWDFSTPAAAIAVRGTEFALSFSSVDGTRLAVYEGLVEMQAAETAEGPQPVERIGANQEGWVRRGRPLTVQKTFSPEMQRLRERRAELRKRMAVHQQGWSVWNPQDRKELRKKMVPAFKKQTVKPKPKPTRKRRNRSLNEPL